jgi:hypothetical protein
MSMGRGSTLQSPHGRVSPVRGYDRCVQVIFVAALFEVIQVPPLEASIRYKTADFSRRALFIPLGNH